MRNKIISIVTSIIAVFALTMSIPFAYAATDNNPPSDVEGLKAAGANESIKLSWNASTDDTGIKGYRIYYGLESVTVDGGKYMFTKDVSNVVSDTIDNLSNGVPYYFAITAVDTSNNESEFYSVEVSATPEGATSETAEDTAATEPAVETTTEENDQSIVDSIDTEEQDALDENQSGNDNDTAATTTTTVQTETKTETQAEEAQVEEVAKLLEPIISNFVAKVEEENKVRVSWTLSQGDNNLKDQIFYQSEDGKNFDSGKSLGTIVRDYLISNLSPGKTYTFKMIPIDLEGKEGTAVTTSITLPQTGAGIAGLIAVSMGVAGIFGRRKNKKLFIFPIF